MQRRSIVILATALLGFAALQGFAGDNYFITTVAGTGKAGYSGDGGPATNAMLNWLEGSDFWVTSSGEIYIAEGRNNRVRKVDAAGTITTVAGNGSRGFSGDGGPATAACLNNPAAVEIDRQGNLYIGDCGNLRIRKVDRSGIITTIAGNGTRGHGGDGGPAIAAQLDGWLCLRFDPDGNLLVGQVAFIGERTVFCRIRSIDPSGTITAFAGTGAPGSAGDGGPAIEATLGCITGLFFSQQGDLYIGDYDGRRVRKIDRSGVITTVAGGGDLLKDDGQATKTYFLPVWGASVDANGNIYIGEMRRVRKVDASGVVSTIAGTGKVGYSGDGGPAIEATLSGLQAPLVAADGSIFVMDNGNYVIRKLYRQ